MAQSVEEAGFKYVGMNYATAKTCANAMRSGLTFSEYVWEWGTHYETDTGAIVLGWYKAASTPMIESDVSIVKTGKAGLYDVVVKARAT
jgi:hypothetical protein